MREKGQRRRGRGRRASGMREGEASIIDPVLQSLCTGAPVRQWLRGCDEIQAAGPGQLAYRWKQVNG